MPTSWRPPGAELRGPKVNSRIWLRAVDDSATNTVLCTTIIITMIDPLTKFLSVRIYY